MFFSYYIHLCRPNAFLNTSNFLLFFCFLIKQGHVHRGAMCDGAYMVPPARGPFLDIEGEFPYMEKTQI